MGRVRWQLYPISIFCRVFPPENTINCIDLVLMVLSGENTLQILTINSMVLLKTDRNELKRKYKNDKENNF